MRLNIKCSVTYYLFFIVFGVDSLKLFNKNPIENIQKTVQDFNCNLHKTNVKYFPHTHLVGLDPCAHEEGSNLGVPSTGINPAGPDGSLANNVDGAGIGNFPTPNFTDKNIGESVRLKNNGQQIPTSNIGNNGLGQNGGPVYNTGVPNTQYPSGNIGQQPSFNNGNGYPTNQFIPNNGQWNPINGYPYNQIPNNLNSQPTPWNNNVNPTLYQGPYYPYIPNGGQPAWGNQGPYPNNLPNYGNNPLYNPNQGVYTGNNGQNFPYPGTNGQFLNTNGQIPNANNQFPNTNAQFPSTNNQYPNNQNSNLGQSNGLPNISGQTPNQNSHYPNNQNANQSNLGQNSQYPSNQKPNQSNFGEFPSTTGQYSNQGSNSQFPYNQYNPNGQPNLGNTGNQNNNGQPIWGNSNGLPNNQYNPNGQPTAGNGGNQIGNGQSNLGFYPGYNPQNNQYPPNQGSNNQYPNNQYNPNSQPAQGGNFNGQPIWGNSNQSGYPSNTAQNSNQFPYGQSNSGSNNQPVRQNNNTPFYVPQTPSPNGIVFPTSAPQSQYGQSGRSLLNNANTTTVLDSGTNLGFNSVLTTTTASTVIKKKPVVGHSNKRKNEDYEDEDDKPKKKHDSEEVQERTPRPTNGTAVTVPDDAGKSLIGNVKTNCQEGFVADKAGICREKY